MGKQQHKANKKSQLSGDGCLTCRSSYEQRKRKGTDVNFVVIVLSWWWLN